MTDYEYEKLQELRKIRKALECLINGVLICPDSDPEKEKIPGRKHPKIGRGHHKTG